MTQENKDLLLQDLCARLPYGVKVNAPFTSNKKENAKGYKINNINFGVVEWTPTLFGEKKRRNSIIIEAFSEKYNQYCSIDLELNNNIEEVKLYLFPLSSMTEEQKNQLKEIWDADMNKALDYAISGEEGLSDLFQLSAAKKVINWFIKNHFDFQGLIPKELAIDCTNLNVY